MNETQIGYCTNVHAGVTVSEVKKNLVDYACEIKKRVRPDEMMGVGLWLSNETCQELISHDLSGELSHWLRDHGLFPFTCNGFPYSDFHQAVVKHRVYRPTWADPRRLDYTVRLAQIHADLLQPDAKFGTISTLPLGWPHETDDSFFEQSARNLRACAQQLVDLRQQQGVHIFLCIEPEPGCLLDTSEDVVRFFQKYLLTDGDAKNLELLDFVGVCHDVCHSAVMMEEQCRALDAYRDAGIRVGKFQISSAIEADFRHRTQVQQRGLIAQLRRFSEDRYLHQTTVTTDGKVRFYEDLPLALQQEDAVDSIWRVHFHVPIHADALESLGTSQGEIDSCLSHPLATDNEWPTHFEIETYAWNVLPVHLRSDSLVDSVVREIKWFENKLHLHRNA